MNSQQARDYATERMEDMSMTHCKVDAVNVVIKELRRDHNFTVCFQDTRIPIEGVSFDLTGITYIIPEGTF